jgi:hypothetical protein
MIRTMQAAAVISITLLLLAAGAGCQLFRQEAPDPGTETGDEISFTASELFTGEQLQFPDDFAGQVVYLVFFADG